MQDALLKLRTTYAYQKTNNWGVVTTVPPDAAITANGNTGYFLIKNTSAIPILDGLNLDIIMSGVSNGLGITTTGAPTAVNIVFTVTFSDDGAAAAGQTITSKTVVIPITANAGVAPGELSLRLGAVPHAYIQVAWAITFTAGSSPTAALGLLDVSLTAQPTTVGATNLG